MHRLTAKRLLARLRQALARGVTFRQLETSLRIPRSTLGDLAQQHRLPRRRRGLPPEKRRLVKRLVARGYGGRRIEREAGVSRDTAWAYQQAARFRELIKRADTPRPCKPWRCPVDGWLINLSICPQHGTRKPPRLAKPRS